MEPRPATALDLGRSIGQRRTVRFGPNAAPAEDAPLVSAARAGDRGAFETLYGRYTRMVHGILLAWAPRDAVEDLVQDVFILAFQRLGSLRDETAFGAWLGAIARHRASDHHRRSRPTEELTDDLAVPDSREAEARAALAAIQSLPEAYRETLMLRLVEGMTGPEIAVRTGLTPDSVRVNLHRGMQKLREKLGRSAADA